MNERPPPARQQLLLAAARLASGDTDGSLEEYRNTFAQLAPARRTDMRRVAEWDLKEMAKARGVSAGLRKAVEWIRAQT